MRLVIKNQDLILYYQILVAVKAKGRKARAISKLKKILMPKIESWQEDQRTLIGEHYVQDENGNAKTSDDGKLILTTEGNRNVYLQEREVLDKEEIIIDLTEFQPFYDFLLSALNEWDEPINGVDADVYDELMDKLEELKPKGIE